MQNIQFNGQNLAVKEQMPIAAFLEEHILQDGDRLNLFSMVGGG